MIHRRAIKLSVFSSTFHRDDWKTRWRFHSVDPTSTQVSTLGHGIIHSLVASVVCGRWTLANVPRRMPGSTKNVVNCAIWCLRGSLDENTGFLCCLKLSGCFDCIGILYSSICIGTNLQNCQNTLVKHQIFQNAFSLPTQNCSFFSLSLVQYG